MHNAYFYGFLKTTAKLYDIVGDTEKAQSFTELASQMGNQLIEESYDFDTGLFRDASQSTHVSLHANVIQLFYNLVPPKGFAPIKDFIMQKGLACGVYVAFFLLQGLYNAGYTKEAFALLNGKEKNSWQSMLACGATTSLEVWSPELKWNTSFCHPWSSSPIHFYISEIMGLRFDNTNTQPLLTVQPHIPDTLEHATLQLPLPVGNVVAQFKKEKGVIIYEIFAPKGVNVCCKGENIQFILKSDNN